MYTKLLVLFLITLSTLACSKTEVKVNVIEKKVTNIEVRYVKDQIGLCYAALDSKSSNGHITTSITSIDCSVLTQSGYFK